LAAYVDHGLSGDQRRRLEKWLADHPEVRAELEAQRRLARLWPATAPPDPGEAAWNAARIRAWKKWQQPRRIRVSFGLLRAAALTAAAVAALVLILDRRVAPVREVPMAAPTLGQLEVISMDPADAGPAARANRQWEAFVPAAPEDIIITSVQPDVDGMVPALYLPKGDAAVPMIVAPLRGVPPSEGGGP
jgi:anti-sigma factor RsiW